MDGNVCRGKRCLQTATRGSKNVIRCCHGIYIVFFSSVLCGYSAYVLCFILNREAFKFISFLVNIFIGCISSGSPGGSWTDKDHRTTMQRGCGKGEYPSSGETSNDVVANCWKSQPFGVTFTTAAKSIRICVVNICQRVYCMTCFVMQTVQRDLRCFCARHPHGIHKVRKRSNVYKGIIF